MLAWWEAMTLVEQIFAVVGIASTVLLVIEVILLLIGAGHGGDADVGADAPGDVHFDPAGEIHPGVPGGADFDVSGHMDMPQDLDIHIGGVTADGISDVDISAVTDAHGGMADMGGPAGTHDTHTHFGASGLHLFTLQGLVAFFAVFGWSGLLMLKSGMLPVASVILAIVFGIIAMVLIAAAMRAMMKLQSDGTLDIRNALGKSGTVYLPIHEKRSAAGKVSLMVQSRLVEMDAVTDGDETIPTGAEVTVVGISNGNTLIVVKK